ncbi:MAG: hypothetical protein WA761_00515 [Thermoplasmata archaeon]
MGESAVLVVGETPSLGRSIVDLLEAENVPVRLVRDVDEEPSLLSLSSRFPIVIAACNGYICTTARRWARGELPDVAMIVVGARDPELAFMPGIHTVSLPLRPNPFLSLVRAIPRSISRARDLSRPHPVEEGPGHDPAPA